MLSDMPEATGQKKCNSGVFLQGRYEIQVLDSFGLIPRMGDCPRDLHDRIRSRFPHMVPKLLERETLEPCIRRPRCDC